MRDAWIVLKLGNARLSNYACVVVAVTLVGGCLDWRHSRLLPLSFRSCRHRRWHGIMKLADELGVRTSQILVKCKQDALAYTSGNDNRQRRVAGRTESK